LTAEGHTTAILDAVRFTAVKFILGYITALISVVIAAVIFAAAYDVSASAPETAAESKILHAVMKNSVSARAGAHEREAWSDEELRKGFKGYDEMCIICHSAPGKERRPISKGMRPQPPNLAEASKQWTTAQLFWIIKNGVKMTGMPAFGPTHSDEEIWNLVGFVRILPEISADKFRAMENEYKDPGKAEEEGHHH
jgi:mono/diheme cytochrome c family protein